MLSAFRSRLAFANVMAVMAVFIFLGGMSYAATSKNVRDGSLTGRDIKNGSQAADPARASVPCSRLNPSTVSGGLSVFVAAVGAVARDLASCATQVGGSRLPIRGG